MGKNEIKKWLFWIKILSWFLCCHDCCLPLVSSQLFLDKYPRILIKTVLWLKSAFCFCLFSCSAPVFSQHRGQTDIPLTKYNLFLLFWTYSNARKNDGIIDIKQKWSKFLPINSEFFRKKTTKLKMIKFWILNVKNFWD